MHYNLEIRGWNNEVGAVNGDNLRQKRERKGQRVEAILQTTEDMIRPRCWRPSAHCRSCFTRIGLCSLPKQELRKLHGAPGLVYQATV